MDDLIRPGNWPDNDRPGLPLTALDLDEIGRSPMHHVTRAQLDGLVAMARASLRTDADVALAGEVGMRAGIEAAKGACGAVQRRAKALAETATQSTASRQAFLERAWGANTCREEIDALTPPPSDALAAMVAAAREEGAAGEREACAAWHDSEADRLELIGIRGDVEAHRKHAAGIRARATAGGVA